MSNSIQAADALDALEQQNRNGANWFYWIAGLSMITAILQIAGSDINFVVGLGRICAGVPVQRLQSCQRIQ